MNNRPLTPSVFHATLKISASIIIRKEEENITATCDGVPGSIITMFTAYSVFLKFSKVWERNNIKQKDWI
jgi:hypothetical protein